MADTSSQLILAALSRAAAAPAGVPLHGGKNTPGLFPNTGAGRQAAQRCRDEGYLSPLTPPALPAPPAFPPGTTATLVKKKSATAPEPWALTDKGWAYLFNQGSPRPVLEDLVRVLEARHGQAGELLALARQLQADMEALKANAEKVLHQIPRPESPAAPSGQMNALFSGFRGESSPVTADRLPAALLAHLARWQSSNTSEDCPLPDLYRALAAPDPGLSVGQFHDLLRRLYAAEQIYLHPWTGPLYDLPEPPYALLVGHEIAYYASVKK